ncbi:HD domain-containing phosphohydrolase [Lachnospiraceae bacterium 54-53]
MQMQYTKNINNHSVLEIIRRFCNYIDPRLTEHGSHVAYISFCMLRETGQYTEQELRDICFAAQLHDVGAYKTEEIARMIQFETSDVWDHSIYGYLFIRYFSPLKKLAPAIFLHHTGWKLLERENGLSSRLKDISQLIHIADRIDVSMSLENRSWEQTLRSLEQRKGTVFAPHMADLAARLDFKGSIENERRRDREYSDFLTRSPLSGKEITDYLKMLVFIIDFRSHHTVTHTITTTSISYELGKLLSLTEDRQNAILCGALLHDLGKIAVPVEILESPGRLNARDMAIMRTHVDLTEKIFGGSIDESIQRIALRHHEKLDGSGYPKGLTAADLTVEERLVAIADIISALTGTRSYKNSFPPCRIRSILIRMKNDGLLDAAIIDLACENLEAVLEATSIRCQPVLSIYGKLKADYESLLRLHSFSGRLHFALSIKGPENDHLWP